MKAWLSDQGVGFVLRDVSRDREAAEEFLRAGYLLPPVTVVDGQAIAGFQPRRLAALLEEV